MEIIDRIFADKPPFHRIDTEVNGEPRYELSTLPLTEKAWLKSSNARHNWGISPELAHYLFGSLRQGMTTIETGSGISTLVFALGGTSHTAVTPNVDEAAEIKKYAATVDIDVSRVTFVIQPSEDYLPTVRSQFDLVLVDGKHTFPWPILDWYYSADQLKVGGLMIVDDTQLRSVAVLCEFLKADYPRWTFEQTVGSRTAVFRKIKSPIGDVAWHEQPWNALWKPTQRTAIERALARVRRKLGIMKT